MQDFRIHNPYRLGVPYGKAQLHTHSSASIDSKWRASDLISVYRDLGFDFLCITDHDKVTTISCGADGRNDGRPVMVTGEESTVVYPVWPLGRHLLRLFVSQSAGRSGSRNPQSLVADAKSQGGLAAVCHPSWRGNLGLGSWPADSLIQLKGFKLIEVSNYHSDPAMDAILWDQALINRGPADPLWAIAVDDAHRPDRAGKGWVEAQALASTPDALRDALAEGAFYATTGLCLDFGADMEEGVWRVWVRRRTPEPGTDTPSLYAPGAPELKCTFIADGTPVKEEYISSMGHEASYRPTGQEAYVRIEVRGGARAAWGQPFWLMPVPEGI